jgi:hypothetical protein
MQKPLPCPGTVTVHRDNATTCTSPACPRHVTRDTWFGLHTSFLVCTVVHGPRGCPDCAFDDVVVDMADRRRARHHDHLPARRPGRAAPSVW